MDEREVLQEIMVNVGADVLGEKLYSRLPAAPNYYYAEALAHSVKRFQQLKEMIETGAEPTEREF